jgi:hypothetical protein
MFGRTLIIAAVLVGLASAQQAHGEGRGNEFLANLLGGGLSRQGESFACFSRQYSDEQLAADREQRVTYVKALIAAYFQESSFAFVRGFYWYQVSLAFRFRDRAETLTQVAECGDGKPRDSLWGGANCAGPGEGGSHLALQGRQVLVIAIPNGADLWAPGPINQRHDIVKNPFGPDDKVFRLLRTDLKECEDLAFDRWKPLRPHEP